MSATGMFGASFWQAVMHDLLLYTVCFGMMGLLGVLATAAGLGRAK